MLLCLKDYYHILYLALTNKKPIHMDFIKEHNLQNV